MNRNSILGLAPVALTLVALWGLLLLDPFRLMREAFTKGIDDARDDALVTRMYTDPHTQETSNGSHPLNSLQKLESDWCGTERTTRFVLMGNSQTFTLMLAPQEQFSPNEERTYPDLLLTRLRSSGTFVEGYRLSAPNISYMEVLWYVHYLLTRRCLIPNHLIVQLNFETFRKTGIRDGMLELLKDPAFANAVGAEAHSSEAYAATFQQAIDRYKAQLAKQTGANTGAAAVSKTGMIETRGVGTRFETKLRKELDRSVVFRSRATLKGEFLDVLYLMRVHVLGIKPTSRRSIGGATLRTNLASLERVGELCRQNGIRLTLFNAPQNPSTPLYRTEQDREHYREVVTAVANRFAFRYFDFENSIPKGMWGVWIEGPDPIHFGRAAHRRLAELMFTAGVIGTR